MPAGPPSWAARPPLANCIRGAPCPAAGHGVGVPLQRRRPGGGRRDRRGGGIGADLQPGTLLAAYRCGLFPMPVANRLAWWSPDPWGVIPLDGLIVSRSLRKSCRPTNPLRHRFRTGHRRLRRPIARGSMDRPADEERLRAPARARLGTQRRGLVNGRATAGQIAGGLYGVAIGGLFAGESMFYRQRDASKVALVALVEALRAGGGHLLDVQWLTPHLASLGAVAVSRRRYHELLREAVDLPQLCLEPYDVPGEGD